MHEDILSESTSELDFEESNTLVSPSDLHSKLIYHDVTIYEGWIFFSGMLNQLQNWILRIGLSDPHSNLIYHDDTIYEGLIDSRFILVHKCVLVITQGYIGDNEQGLYIGLID